MLLMSRGFVLGDWRHERTGARLVHLQRRSHVDVQRQHVDSENAGSFSGSLRGRPLFSRASLSKLLHRIAETPISPELMPPAEDGSIRQSTEAVIGAYELHDFFLYHFVRNGFDREKILYLGQPREVQSSPIRVDDIAHDARHVSATVLLRTSSNATVCPTVPRSVRSVCRRAAIGECPAMLTPTRFATSRPDLSAIRPPDQVLADDLGG